MQQRYSSILALLLLAACGGDVGDELGQAEPEQPDQAELDQADPELGIAEQAAMVDAGKTFGFRADLAGSNSRCGGTVATEVCVVPPDKTVTFRATGTGMSAGQKTEAESLIDGFLIRLADDFPTYTLSRITSGTADVMVSYGTQPGTNKNSIHTYAHATQSGGTTLNDFGATGTWIKYGSVQCVIDNQKIQNDFLASQEPKVRSHAIDYCLLKGLGTGSGGGAVSRPHAIAVTPDAVKVNSLSNKTWCIADSYQPAGNDVTFFLDPFCSGQTDN